MRMLSHVASIARGSVGGLTYTANQFHQIVCRARTSPVNPNTTRQSQIRAAFANAGALWGLLSDADRTLWNEYAATLSYPGPLGSYTIPGRQVALGNVATAFYLDLRGTEVGSPDASPPATPGFLSCGNLIVAPPGAGLTGFTIAVLNDNAEDVSFYGFRTYAFGPARIRCKGPFLSESLVNADSVASAGSGLLVFTGLVEDMVYFVKLRCITEDPPYKLSRDYFIRAVAVATPA